MISTLARTGTERAAADRLTIHCSERNKMKTLRITPKIGLLMACVLAANMSWALAGSSANDKSALAGGLYFALVANYAGDEVLSPETQAKIQEFVASPDPRDKQLGMLLYGIWIELYPADNNLVFPFAPPDNSIGRPGGIVGPPGTPPPGGDDFGPPGGN
jgi:hypothetical protein